MYRGQAAVQQSGIVAAHAALFSRVAQDSNQFILFRKVEKWATGLIKDNFPTKDLHVKGKSSTWGPQAGLICCDQSLSKLHGQAEKVIEFNGKVHESLHHGFAMEAPLVISEARLRELHRLGAVRTLDVEHQTGRHVLWRVTTKEGEVFFLMPTAVAEAEQKQAVARFAGVFDAIKAVITSVAENGLWVFRQVTVRGEIKDLRLVTVLANKDKLPLTADYDVFAICPHLSTGGYEVPSTASPGLRFKAAVGAVRTALGQADRRTIDVDLGRMSAVQRRTKDRLNQAARQAGYAGGNVVHHGTEVDNPVTELDFPVTAFVPGPSGAIYGAQTQGELERLVADIKRAGYAFYGNRLWQAKGGAITPGRPLEKSKMERAWDDSFTVGTAFEVLSQGDVRA